MLCNMHIEIYWQLVSYKINNKNSQTQLHLLLFRNRLPKCHRHNLQLIFLKQKLVRRVILLNMCQLQHSHHRQALRNYLDRSANLRNRIHYYNTSLSIWNLSFFFIVFKPTMMFMLLVSLLPYAVAVPRIKSSDGRLKFLSLYVSPHINA